MGKKPRKLIRTRRKKPFGTFDMPFFSLNIINKYIIQTKALFCVNPLFIYHLLLPKWRGIIICFKIHYVGNFSTTTQSWTYIDDGKIYKYNIFFLCIFLKVIYIILFSKKNTIFCVYFFFFFVNFNNFYINLLCH